MCLSRNSMLSLGVWREGKPRHATPHPVVHTSLLCNYSADHYTSAHYSARIIASARSIYCRLWYVHGYWNGQLLLGCTFRMNFEQACTFTDDL